MRNEIYLYNFARHDIIYLYFIFGSKKYLPSFGNIELKK